MPLDREGLFVPKEIRRYLEKDMKPLPTNVTVKGFASITRVKAEDLDNAPKTNLTEHIRNDIRQRIRINQLIEFALTAAMYQHISDSDDDPTGFLGR
jgi:hypothetical protein